MSSLQYFVQQYFHFLNGMGLRILYISGQRGEELPLLSRLGKLEKLSFRCVKFHLRSILGLSLVATILTTFKFCIIFKPNLLLLEGPGLFGIIAILLQQIYKIPLAVRLKGDPWEEYSEIRHDIPIMEKVAKFLNYRAGIILLRRAEIILPISDHMANVVNRNLRESTPLYVVNIPFRKIDKHDESDICVVEGDFVLTVTNFNFWGKVEPLANAIKRISDILTENDLTWVILGDGFFLNRFKEQLENKINFDAVKLLGRKNTSSFYKKALAMFYISGMDGLPNVLLESFYYKLPVIIDVQCPAAEFVQQNYTGIVADFNDVEYLRRLIMSLKEHSLSRGISERAHEYVIKEFSVENVSKQLEKALSSVVVHKQQYY